MVTVGDLTPRTARPTPFRPTGARSEPLSPFVAWTDDARAPIEVAPGRRSLFVEMVAEPALYAARLLEPGRTQATIGATTAAMVTGAVLFAALVRLDEGLLVALGAGLRLALSLLLAVAAALGPIHAAGLLVAARVPLPRLVAVMMGAMAAGTTVLAPLAPLVRFLHRYDAMWAGPLALVGAFGLGSLVAGVTLSRLLGALARETLRAREGRSAELAEADVFRVGIVSRLALVFLGYTAMLALWGLGAFT